MKKITLITVLAVCVCGAGLLAASGVSHSSFFNAKALVFVYNGKTVGSLQFKDKVNIFDIDTNKVASCIRENAPMVKRVAVSRQFPNKLIARLEFRRPLAQIELAGKYYLAGDSVIDYPSSTPWGDFVIVSLDSPSVRSIADKEVGRSLARATSIIGLIKKMGLRCNKVTLSQGSRRFTCSFANNVDVMFVEEDFPDKLFLIKQLFRSPAFYSHNIGYIDFRFDKPIIKRNNRNA
jgi:hypothetical protein